MTVKGDTQVSPEQEYWCFFHENGTYSDGHSENSLERVRQGEVSVSDAVGTTLIYTLLTLCH